MSSLVFNTSITDTIRKCMLRSNITLDLDDLVSASPLQRILLISKVLHKKGGESGLVGDLMHTSGIMDALRTEAHRRNGSEFHGVSMLTTADAPAHNARSVQNSQRS